MELTGPRRVTFVVALVLAIFPWVYQFTFVNTATGSAQQITAFIAALLGIISFCAVAALAFASGAGTATYWLAAAGPILFQAVEARSSAIALFTPSPIACGVVALAWYGIAFFAMSFAQKRGAGMFAVVALAVALLPLVVFLVRLI